MTLFVAPGRTGSLRTMLPAGLVLVSCALLADCSGAPGKRSATSSQPPANGPEIEAKLEVTTQGSSVKAHIRVRNGSATQTYSFEPEDLFAASFINPNLLDVTCDGKRARFLGAMVKRKPTPWEKLVVLRPGQRLDGERELGRDYQFRSGTQPCTARYSADVQTSRTTGATIQSLPASFTVTR